jgi:hypothetical protein
MLAASAGGLAQRWDGRLGAGAAGLAEHQAARQSFHTRGELAVDGGEEPLGSPCSCG